MLERNTHRRWFSLCTAVALLPAVGTAHADFNPLGLASRQLSRALNETNPDVTQWSVSPIGSVSSEEVIASTVEPAIAVIKTGARSAVRVSWLKPDATKHAQTIWFDVVGMQRVAVAARDLKAGEIVSASDTAILERDVIAVNCSTVATTTELSGQRLRRALRAGSVLCRDQLEPPPAVARGDKVTVHYVSNRIALTTTGVAQHDAQVGQKLRIVNPASKDSFVARVTAVREVEIYE